MIQQLQTDVVVLGAGIAGVAAAVAAARQGLSVTLVEKNDYPGGKATAAEVGTICGLYKFNRSLPAQYIVKGFAREFAEELQRRSNTTARCNAEGLHYLPYDVEAFKALCVQVLAKENITCFYHSHLENLEQSDDQLVSISIRNNNNVFNIKCNAVVDCSGDSQISQLANHPLIESDRYQAAAQVFSLQGVSEDNEARLGLILIKALQSGILAKKLPAHFDRVYPVQGSLKHGMLSLKIGIPVPVTYEPGNLEEIRAAGLAFIHQLVQYLTAEVAAFKNASIAHIADEAGMRVGRRTKGRYVLTEEDVLGCHKFPDGVAYGSWPIEEWQQQRRVNMQYFSEDDFYQVPAGCLQSLRIQNLFLGGRHISASDPAIASARVMGICLQTGYAAGLLAAGFVKGDPILHTVKDIQTQQL